MTTTEAQTTMPASTPSFLPALAWDILCRVVDNHGDLGVCWRLACRLGSLGHPVRLWVDDARALSWMAPGGAPGVAVLPWRPLSQDEAPGDVVVETFGGDLPEGWLTRMAAAERAPVWIDLEYLSAEAYVARSHTLPSPQMHGPGAGLTRWFFYPGFTNDTGGLLLEEGLAGARERFDASAWLAELGVPTGSGPSTAEIVKTISLFCYQQPALAAWLALWRTEPTRLLVTPGPAALQVAGVLGCECTVGTSVQRDALTAHFLPWLPQPEFDHLLWACDLNHVRGEDSLVRALWAARPFIWQAYPQDDGAHWKKLQAFIDRYAEAAPAPLAAALRQHFTAWNQALPQGRASALPSPPDGAAWAAHARAHTRALQSMLDERGDLARQLHRFALAKR